MRTAILIILLLFLPIGGWAAEPVCVEVAEGYPEALCFYHQDRLAEAEAAFRGLVESDEPRPETLKARYFLVRTLMKLRRWPEASTELIKIYSISPSFYREWSGDFLLGEIRRAQGLG
jgi:hypothetical protein